MPVIEPKFWENPAFQRSIPPFPFVVKASRAQRPGNNVVVPAGMCAVVLVVCLTPIWPRLPAWLPSPWSEISEWGPLIVIVAAAVAAELIRDQMLKSIRDKSRLEISAFGVELIQPGRRVKLNWRAITALGWDSDPGNKRSYLVAELNGAGGKIRVSEQFFRDKEVRMIYGLAKLKLRELDDDVIDVSVSACDEQISQSKSCCGGGGCNN